MTPLFRIVFLAFALLQMICYGIPTTSVQAQGSRADYERSRTINRSRVRTDIAFHWLSDSTLWFWSPQQDPALMFVDANTAARKSLFTRKNFLTAIDTDANQAAPRRRAGIEVESIDLEKQTLVATYRDKRWSIQYDDDQETPLVATQLEDAADSDAADAQDGDQRPGGRNNRGRNRGRNRRAQSPDGEWTARIVDNNLEIESEDGTSTRLSETGRSRDPFVRRFYWSPDSKYLAAIQETKPDRRTVTIVQSSPNDQLQPKLVEYDYYKPGDIIPVARVRLFDIESKKQIEVDESLFDNAWNLTRLSWAPDSSRFRFLFNQRGHQTMRYISVDPLNGDTLAVINEETNSFFDYSGKLRLDTIDDTNELIWMSERDGWNHLYLFDSKTGSVKNQITKGDWVVRKVQRVDRDKRQIWFTAGGIIPGQDPYYIHFCRIDFDGTNLTVLTDGDGTHSITYSPDSSFLIDKYSRVDLAPIFELRRVSDGKKIIDLDSFSWDDASKLTEASRPERFVSKGRDGETDIYGVIFRPSNFDPEKTYPVVENIYAGPHDAFVPKGYSNRHGSQSMAELGFIVVRIDGMGTSQRSKAFHDICWKNLGDSGFPDRIKWIKSAAEQHPEMDISRVGIYGGSAGGQSALRGLLAHPEFYSVGTADCGCHDNRMDKIWWNELWMGWPIGPHYKEQSNVTQAHRLEGKLMLILGELDRNVDPASTMQVVNALIKADKDFDLVVIPNAGHGATGTPYGRRRMRDFFVRNLLDVEPRWEPESK